MSTITVAEVKKHNTQESCWIIIHNNVYDVTKFLSEHPGGQDILLRVAGSDATQAFEDAGHSDDARILLKKYMIGKLPAEESKEEFKPCCKTAIRREKERAQKQSVSSPPPPPPEREEKQTETPEPQEPQDSRWWLYALLALGVAAAGAVAYKKYSSGD